MSAKQLRRQRGQVKAKLTAAINFVHRIAGDAELTTREEVESRLRNLEEAYVKFQAIVQQLIVIVPEEDYETRDLTEKTDFDERYFSVKASLLQVIEKLNSVSPASTSSNGNQENDGTLSQVLDQQATIIRQLSERSNETSGGSTLSQILEQQMRILERLSVQSGSVRETHVKLPIIKLPTFDGTIEEWKRYADTFKNLIHESELSNVQKHQYLVGSLSGPAAKIIESIDISDQNYEIAWELLKKRYEDERAIRKRHIQCLFELPRVHRESATAIQELLDHVHKHLRVLQSMKLPTEAWGELIIHLIEKNLDSSTRGRWEEHIEELTEVTTTTMTDFLQRRCQVLKRASLNEVKDLTIRKTHGHERNDGNKRGLFHAKLQPKTSLSTTIQGGRCYWCQGQHLIYTCSEFLRLPAEDRLQEVRRKKLCINCLRNDHFVKECKASSCRKCGERHNTLCHPISEGTSSTTNTTKKAMGNAEKSSSAAGGAVRSDREARVSDSTSGASVYHLLSENRRKEVLMSTAIVNVRESKGQLRILLDSASETNFITMEACKKLNLKLEDIHEFINGLNDMNCVIKHGCRLQIQSRTSNFNVNVCCLVVPKITKNLPSFSIQTAQLSIPENVKLADPFFASPGKIDALIGAEFFMSLLQNGKIELGKDLPTLQNSKLGWIISGSISENFVVGRSINRQPSNAHTCLFVRNENINNTLLKFWELEEYQGNQNTKLSTEEQACENHFINTQSRDTSGRFIVRLPFRTNKAQLGESREIAIKRLCYLERKFQRDKEFHKQYSNFMREYIKLNHMSRITDCCDTSLPTYLPHHGVLRETSITTKLRVVFDGSAKTTSGISLNDTLMVGATLQDNIIDIILRFRLHAIAITADLKKMYRQILVHEKDRNYQRIVWRFSSRDPIQEFQLNTVTYGLACAPFLAIRCVKQLAGDAISDFSEASYVLLNDLYVDDILTGVKCTNDAINLITQLKNLLNSGGFELHKLHSNCKEIVNKFATIDSDEKSSSVKITVDTIKTLGLNWNPERDIFHFSSQLINNSIKTKREVLSAISKLFDPLGLISPISIRAKLIMQGTWSSNLNWDDQLTHEIQQAWDAYADDLKEIHAIEIPRRVISSSNANQFYLHAFCDASLKAYGACVYLQTIDNDNN
ncbi:uncharacterized protein LOC114928760, partial [Nylanderia fulva]|uniref:uncharacterized protein LOC114928760 n=1 Tax=Nylanderia fulva TaxID=613905 RepID=UPI0010FAEC86